MKCLQDIVGENIRKRREARGFSKKELAARACCAEQQVGKWEKGLHLPDTANLLRLADALACTVDELLGRK